MAKHGGNHIASLTQGAYGNFYGTTTIGRTHNEGTAFQITTNGSLATLFSFSGGFDGAQPQGSLIQGSDGSFYGTTSMGGEGGSDRLRIRGMCLTRCLVRATAK